VTSIAFMTANYVARETGWDMHGWGHGDRATNEAFRPLETFGERFDAVLANARGLGFEAIDLWGAHLNPAWATEEHVAAACDALARHRLRVCTYATWVDGATAARACEIALRVGTTVIGAGTSAPLSELVSVLRDSGVRLAIENHPEKTPAELLAKIETESGTLCATVDTGWWATHGYDPAQAIAELGEFVQHVHLKDVKAVGEPHETCCWGEGIVDVEGCVRALQGIGYEGAIAVEHEPEDHDPSDACREMLVELKGWLA
jgi:sugar phosphate isomerase/epimerase